MMTLRAKFCLNLSALHKYSIFLFLHFAPKLNFFLSLELKKSFSMIIDFFSCGKFTKAVVVYVLTWDTKWPSETRVLIRLGMNFYQHHTIDMLNCGTLKQVMFTVEIF